MNGSGTRGLRGPSLPSRSGEYVPILLSPRMRESGPRESGPVAETESTKQLPRRRRERPPQRRRRSHDAPSSSREKRQRREFLQSLVSGIAINGILAALLLFTAIHERTPPPPSLFKVTARNDPEKSPESSGKAPPTPHVSDEATGVAASPAVSMITTTTLREFSVTPKLRTGFTPSMASPDVLTPNMGASLASTDFATAKLRKKQALREFIESNGVNGNRGGGVFTISEGELRGLLSTDEFGDGSGLLLLTDVSGSMREIGETVDSYVKRTFPGSRSTQIAGCSFKYLTCPAVGEILRSTRRGEYTDLVFVCDLQDGEGAVAVERIRRALIAKERITKFHVISFDRYPGSHLNRLIMDSGGAFTRVSRTSRPKQPRTPSGEAARR